jgi:hypothetical protein
MSGASSSNEIVPATRDHRNQRLELPRDVGRTLVASNQTKQSCIRSLKALADAGMINDIVGDQLDTNVLKRKLEHMSADFANTQTPYGTIVQSVNIGVGRSSYWEYMHPFAFLWYLSTISMSFAAMMRSIAHRTLKVVIYADGLVPGNPFRHDTGRKMQCIYWCIVDWPQHVLQRSFAWPVFSILRESVIHGIQGGLGRIIRTVLRIFFGSSGHSLRRGIHIHDENGGFVVTGTFAGFLQDLVGHKELSEWIGHAGVLCCMTCSNVINMQHRRPRDGQVAANCWDRTKFVYRTNDDVYKTIDDLKIEYDDCMSMPRFPTSRWKAAQTNAGFNLVLEGLLMDHDLRDIYKPVDHSIRDWQHTVAQDGVANTHVAAFIHRISEKCNIAIDRVQDFSQLVNYPSNIGKLERSAFAKGRLKRDTIASFSSIMVTMVFVLHFFADIYISTQVPKEFAASTSLFHIVGILRMGPEDAMPHIDSLRTLIAKHVKELCELYGEYVKPKMHHMFHIPDGMELLGKLLSCFVTERKHKMIKAAALHVFRHFEHTVLTDVVNTTFQQIKNGHDLYRESFLVFPQELLICGIGFLTSRKACIRIGHVQVGDVVVNIDGVVGCVVKFWQQCGGDDRIVVQVDVYPCLNNDIRYASKAQSYRSFMEDRTIVDAVLWIDDSPGIIRICVPPSLLYRRR